MNRRVLVTTYGGAHVAAALPLQQALARAGMQPVMLGLTTAADVLRRHGIATRHFLDYVDMSDPLLRHWGSYLSEHHHREGIGITSEESMAYLGAGMSELVCELGENAALERYRRLGLNALLPIRTLRRILQMEQIDAVIATDSPRAERAALNAAAQAGLPSVCVLTSFPHIGLEYLRRPDNGAVMCVLNERVRQQLLAAGRAPESVVVTGNPAFDALLAQEGESRESLRSRAGLRSDEWTVLWAEQPEPANPGLPPLMREHLGRVCRRHGWRLLVRLHPSSQAADHVALPERALESPRTEPVRDALLKADAVVTFTSTIGFEALLLDKPLVVAAVSQYSSFVDYCESDGAFVVEDIESIEPALLAYFRDDAPARALAIHRRGMPRNGRSAEAVVQCLANQFAASAPIEESRR